MGCVAKTILISILSLGRPQNVLNQLTDLPAWLALFEAENGIRSHIVVRNNDPRTDFAEVAERMRAGGAGIPGFYTRTGVGTLIAEGKEIKEFDGVPYVLERGIFADVSMVKAWKADTQGNLIYRRTARNFNPMAATCGKVTIAEAEIIVEPGELDPDEIHTPGIFIHRLVHNPHPEKRIERRTVREG